MQEVDEGTIVAQCVPFTTLQLVRPTLMTRLFCTEVQALKVTALVS